MTELRPRIEAALLRQGKPSSDYDLNTDVVLPEGRKLRPAAVLVPLVARKNGAGVLLTKRASSLKHHPGQIAFPGGKVEQDDNGAIGAALREAHEEIALPAELVDVVGTLPAHETVTGFTVTPVLGFVSENFDPRPRCKRSCRGV